MDDSKQVKAWCMYDWANSAFATTILAAILPVYFAGAVCAGTPVEGRATSVWGIVTAVSMGIVAILSPVLGAIADSANTKKKFWMFFMLLGCVSTALLFIPQPGDYILLSVIFVFASIGFSGSLVFYDSFLPHIVSRDRMDIVSAKGLAYGYIGGAILLVINMAMMMNPGGIFGACDPGNLAERFLLCPSPYGGSCFHTHDEKHS